MSRSHTFICDRNARALALAEQGYTTSEIAAAIGRHRTTVYNALRRARENADKPIPPVTPLVMATPPRAYTPMCERRARAASAAKYRAMGYSWPEVARLCGYKSHTSAMQAGKTIR